MNELYHHGIKGQKWGIRRYQNEDGTLTAAGRSRYGLEGDRARDRAIRRGAGYDTASRYGSAVAKRNAQYERTSNSAQRVDNVLGLSPKRWKTWAGDYKQLKYDNKEVKRLREEVNTEAKRNRLETKASSRANRRGASIETSQKLGRAYADRYFANKKYYKDFYKAYYSWPFGKKYEERVNRMLESLNDYWIADEIYKRNRLDANSEIRRSNGWR